MSSPIGSLKNVKIQLKNIESNKKIYDDFGEMLFTHFGVSGPTILSSSAHLLRVKKVIPNNVSFGDKYYGIIISRYLN